MLPGHQPGVLPAGAPQIIIPGLGPAVDMSAMGMVSAGVPCVGAQRRQRAVSGSWCQITFCAHAARRGLTLAAAAA